MRTNNKKQSPKYSFAIIKHFNSPNFATTVDGHTVERKETIFIPDWGAFVRCASYDDHFVYEDPEAVKGKKGRWYHMCSCGSPAVIVGYAGYKGDASKDTMPMLVCYIHATTGLHATGGSRWI